MLAGLVDIKFPVTHFDLKLNCPKYQFNTIKTHFLWPSFDYYFLAMISVFPQQAMVPFTFKY